MSQDNDVNNLGKQTNLTDLINKDHIEHMIDCQTDILSQLDKTNETLVNCNAVAKAKLATLNKTFRRSTQQIIEIKKDVEAIHKKVRSLKAKIITDHPEQAKCIESSDTEETSPTQVP